MDRKNMKYLEHMLSLDNSLEEGRRSGSTVDPELQELYNESCRALERHYKLREEYLAIAKQRYKAAL